MSYKDDLKKLMINHERKLQKLKEQRALMGIGTHAHVLIEIEDTEAELQRLQTELGQLNIQHFGPVSGTLKHASSGIVSFQADGVSLSNFIAEATFDNPYSAAYHHWNAVIFFRKDFRIWVDSENSGWGYGYFKESKWRQVGGGKLSSGCLALGEGEANRLKIVAYDSSGCFYVNGKFIADLDLSDVTQPGSISIGISERTHQVEGAITNFRDFVIYVATELDCSK